jgi:hypothetical protein
MTFQNMTSAMLRDVDNDGFVNWWDSDSDNDMLPDSEEGYVRTNAVGLPLFLDPRVETEDDALIPCVARCPSPADRELNANMFDTDNDGDTLCTILDVASTLFVFLFQYPHMLVVVSLLVHGNSFFWQICSRFRLSVSVLLRFLSYSYLYIKVYLTSLKEVWTRTLMGYETSKTLTATTTGSWT